VGFQRFASRFCTFEGPSGWDVVPGLGLVDSNGGAGKRSAVVTESWVDQGQDAATFAQAQIQVLKQERSDAEVVAEERLSSPKLSDGLLLTIRTPLPEQGTGFLQKQLVTVEGPLACTLTVSGREDDQQLWQELCNPMLGSFAVPAREWATGIQEAELVQPASASPPASRQALPQLGITIPVPEGWHLDDKGVLGKGDEASITIQRSGLPAGSAEECFAHALGRLSRQGIKPEAWQQGTTRGGSPFWALDTVAVIEKTWGPAERILRRQVFIDDQGVLAMTLECRSEQAAEALSIIIDGYTWQEPGERELLLAEPWLPAKLTGAWLAAGPGVYVSSEPPGTVVIVQEIAKEKGLADLMKRQVSALRAQPELGQVQRDECTEGVFAGCAAQSYCLDYQDGDGNPVSLRLCMLDTRSSRCVIQVRSGAAEMADSCLRELLGGFKPDATAGGGGVR
jgi:hypothetical protein